MDAMSRVLRSLRLRSSFYAVWELAAPWGLGFRATAHAPFHYLEAGEMWLVTDDGREVHVEAGDMIVLFDGAGHAVADRADRRAEPIEQAMARLPRGWSHRYGGLGAAARLVCGKFAIDERDSGPASLAQLPPIVHLRGARDGLAPLLALLVQELRSGAAGAERAATLMTEALLIHVLRDVLASAPAVVGWMAGLADPQIAIALAAIHGEPDKAWTLAALARAAGLSRSVFAERFHARVGASPMSYLARWRLQLAARWLRETALGVAEILDRLGYASAAAFHRAFKREHGLAPTAYRRAHRVVAPVVAASADASLDWRQAPRRLRG